MTKKQISSEGLSYLVKTSPIEKLSYIERFKTPERENKCYPINSSIGNVLNDYLRNFEKCVLERDYDEAKKMLGNALKFSNRIVYDFGSDESKFLNYQKKFLQFCTDGFLESVRILDKFNIDKLIPLPLTIALTYTHLLGKTIPPGEEAKIRSYMYSDKREARSLSDLTFGGIRYLDSYAEGIRFNRQDAKKIERKQTNHTPKKKLDKLEELEEFLMEDINFEL